MSEKQMQPIIILPPDAMSDDDIQRLRDNGLCVVVANEPAEVTFVDPLPSLAGRAAADEAAIAFARTVLRPNYWQNQTGGHGYRTMLAATFCDLITKGTAIDPLHNEKPIKTAKK